MKEPRDLKGWEFVKNQKHDISRLLDKGLNPADYYYQCNGGVYTPAFAKHEWDKIVNNR